MPTAAPRSVLLIPAFAVGLLAASLVALLSPFGPRIVVAAVVGAAVAGASAVALDRRAPAAVLRAISATPLRPGTQPRLESLVASLCASHGIAEPQLHVVDSCAPDSAVVARPGETHLVVTTGALQKLDRLQLEVVVARQLAQFSSGVHAATTLASVGPLLGPLAETVRRAQLDAQRVVLTDVQGVRMTRYPPALVGAFEQAAEGSGVACTRTTRHLWMIGPLDADPGVQPRLQDRIDALREL
ncbi:MAG: hypothetical protein OXB92_09300 [Acidimicrobiaceae bacterium]|nr:hypothetical protein [Acidimicrobiia bacterium]MCY4494036.1 hypothetical protein [Acidimicrobiaceae bacterium]